MGQNDGGRQLNLASLTLSNYRRFERFNIDLHPSLTVIAARNGQGKTTVLEAAASALGPFVGAFDEGKAEHIKRTDARYRRIGAGPENEQTFPVVVNAVLDDPRLTSTRELRSGKGRTTTSGAAELVHYGKELQDRARYDERIDLPVVRYYSSKRLWVHHNSSRKSVLTESRTAGYEDCLSAMSTFNQLQEWVRAATLADLQQRAQPGYPDSGLGDRLRGIASAVDVVMAGEGWSGFHYSFIFDELAMTHPDHGALPMTVLSDGVRAMAALTADLAQRCARLNGHLGSEAPTRTCGIVLVDEVDLHLHPAWQQRVLPALTEAFPNIQFIVSTHSPQVLSTAPRESIRTVFQDATGAWRSERPSHEVLGLASSVALTEVMAVNPTPDVKEANLIDEYTALIESGQHNTERGNELRRELENFFGSGHQVLIDADRLIRFQKFKLRRGERESDSHVKGMD